MAVPLRRDSRGCVLRASGSVMDVTAERERVRELEVHNERMRVHANRAYFLLDQKMGAIASEIYDNGAQLIALSEAKLDILLHSISNDALTGSLLEIREYLARASSSIQSLNAQIRSPVLDGLGLIAGLEALAAEMGARHGLRIEVAKNGDIPAVDPAKNRIIYRAVQECFSNIVHHAGTGVAKLVMDLDPEKNLLRIQIEDRGVGFDPSRLFDPDSIEYHYGLFRVREEIESLGGHLLIDSEPRRGARVQLSIPLDKS
jgi:signal transduction histidine kinase